MNNYHCCHISHQAPPSPSSLAQARRSRGLKYPSWIVRNMFLSIRSYPWRGGVSEEREEGGEGSWAHTHENAWCSHMKFAVSKTTDSWYRKTQNIDCYWPYFTCFYLYEILPTCKTQIIFETNTPAWLKSYHRIVYFVYYRKIMCYTYMLQVKCNMLHLLMIATSIWCFT